MALEATHIRFALDLKDEYKVKNLEKYILGTVYPDSRYITGIDRDLTHHEDILLPEFAKDDFKKGWQVHQICDLVQNKKREELLPELTIRHNDAWNEKEWIIASAIKIIQDMKDMRHFNIQYYLKYFEYAYNPNGEDINDIKKYNRIVINLYKDKKVTTVEDNYKMWLALGINKEQGDKIRSKTIEFLQDESLVKRIGSIYNGMVSSYKDVLPLNLA